MTLLQSVFPYILGISLAAVVVVLAVGVISMFRGGEFNARWGNRLMRARVALQALAVLLILAFAALMQNSP
ncbi:MAG: twin transmembrane helix small protein [Rhodospirillales bacterium]|nr:twin transmembrane helix small protein [Rhodospirillales bacterium]